MSLKFYRRVAFGLSPNEKQDKDPLNWALSQLNTIPDLLWPGSIPSEKDLRKKYGEWVYGDREVLRKKYKNDKNAYKRAKDELRIKTGERYFELNEHAIRHYQTKYSVQPVFERFWLFWGNHFAISEKDFLAEFSTGPYQREIIRPNMVKTFEDMVMSVTTSWCMIHHLDNSESFGPNSKKGMEWRETINENHARELLELHTVSPNAGYTQEDVIQLAYIMTGWSHKWSRKNLETGDVIQQKNLNAQYFGEGVTVFGNKIYQLTWTSGNVFIYDKSNFELQQTLSISGEGWGLTNDREHLILSNGTSVLQFLDPETLNVVKTLSVKDGEIPVNRLNELEYINGEVWANIFKEDHIARIDIDTGLVKSYVDLSSISERKGSEDVLNGIAYDANTGKIYVTGKNWSKIYEIEIDESVDLSATGTKIYLNDFNASKDKFTAVGFNYANGEELISHVTETKTGGLLFSDQGTEVEIPDLDLQTALSQDIEIILMSSGNGSTEDLSVGQHGGGDSWCCTASFKQGEIPIKKVKAFRRWHEKKSRIWQEGYHIWGRIVADQWLSKSKWAAKGTNDLFNLIMNGKITFRGLLAWLVITPPALLIGSYVVLKKELFKEVKESLIQK